MEEGHMKISIALATYNGEKYLEEQLHSFLTQTHQPDELIICDDGSTDATVAIAHHFAAHAPFSVKLFENEKNLGYAQNFSKALAQCSGDVVFMSDQDDVWHAAKIEKMLARFEGEPELQLLIHDLDYCKENLTPIGQTKIERMEGIFNLERDYVVGMATAIRGSFLKLCLPVPNEVDLSHDSWLHQCAYAVGGKVVMREVLALYRRHPSNTTATGNLNVDFVTTPSHFKGGARASMKLMKTKTALGLSGEKLLLQWVQRNKVTIVDRGYTTPTRIEDAIDDLNRKTEITNHRTDILKLARWKRLFPVINFYCTGGYSQFSGWKSAAKDLLLN